MKLFVFVLLQVFFDSLHWIILTSHVFVYLFLLFLTSTVPCSWCLTSLQVLDIVFAELFWGIIWDLGWLSLSCYSQYLKAWLWMVEKPYNLICVYSCALPLIEESFWAFASQNTFSLTLYYRGVKGVAFSTRWAPCFWAVSRYCPASLK